MTIYIFGERHYDVNNRNKIRKQIEAIMPEYLLHELLYEDICLTKEEIKSRLKNCKSGELCDPRLNDDLYRLGLLLDLKLVGIDIEVIGNSLSIEEKHKIRETHMVSTIKKYEDKEIVVVVGDDHLRENDFSLTNHTSPIIKEFKKRAVIKRAHEL